MPRIGAAIKWTRLISVLAVLSSLVGAVVMFWIGTINTFKTVLLVAGVEEKVIDGSSIKPTELATIELLECLDDFLVGLAFLYFAYGIYSLFIQLGRKDPDTPSWLRVSSIGVLKKNATGIAHRSINGGICQRVVRKALVSGVGMDLFGDSAVNFSDRGQHPSAAV